MGTYVSIEIDGVVIRKDRVEDCKKALLQLKTGGWCDEINEEMTLQEIIEAWRYEACPTKFSGVSITSFRGEKCDDEGDDAFWNTIGEFLDMDSDPYVVVKDDSYGESWDYDFRND